MIDRIVVAGAVLLVMASACSDGDDTGETPTTIATTIATTSTTGATGTATTSIGAVSSTTVPSTTVPSTTAPATTAPGTTAPVTSTTTAPPEDDTIVDPPDAELAASELRAETGCDETDPSRGFAELAWRPASEGSVQRVQVTADSRGFDDGTVVTGPELDAAADAVRWLELEGQAVHSWRVITAPPDRAAWYASPVAQFEGPLCAVDYQNS